MAIVTRTALKLCIALATAISVTAACQNCQEFQFNSVDDAAALSQLQEFLSQHSEYGSTISIDTTIGIEKASAVLKEATNDRWRGWKNAGDRYYKCFTDLKMTYLEAKSHCNIFKGKLAVEVLRDPDIVSNIASICVTQGHHPWIGLDDIQNEGQWVWSDLGSTNDITTRWIDGEPNNGGGQREEDCAQIWTVSRDEGLHPILKINDQECSRKFDFICEV